MGENSTLRSQVPEGRAATSAATGSAGGGWHSAGAGGKSEGWAGAGVNDSAARRRAGANIADVLEKFVDSA